MTETTTLFRPVGKPELDLIRASGVRAFPPRLAQQPIFYPVLNEEYATEIARDWNTKDAASGAVVPDIDDEVFYTDGYYWVRRHHEWYYAPTPHRRWSRIDGRRVPPAIRRLPPGRYRHYHEQHQRH